MSENFMVLLKIVAEYPYSNDFKVADVFPNWGNLSEQEQKDLLREFAVYAWSERPSIEIDYEDVNHISDFDFTYRKSLRKAMDYNCFNTAVETALALRSVSSGRDFTLPELERERGFESGIDSFIGTEKALNDMIEKGCVPFLKIVGESYGFTIYKRL